MKKSEANDLVQHGIPIKVTVRLRGDYIYTIANQRVRSSTALALVKQYGMKSDGKSHDLVAYFYYQIPKGK